MNPVVALDGAAQPVDVLAGLREEIDDIDQAIVDLLGRRARVSRQVARAKADHGLPVYAPDREEALLLRLVSRAGESFPSDSLTAVYREIISACRALQEPLRVAYLGPEETFSHQAARRRFGAASHLEAQASITEVVAAVARGRVNLGVVPVENSSEGGVNQTLDALLESELSVCGEIFLPVSHALISRHDGPRCLAKVYSHPQALAQCRGWLAEHLPGVELLACPSTAAAVETAAAEEHAAAIASPQAARGLGLNLLAENIQDLSSNATRFWVIGRSDCPATGQDRTSLVMVTAHRPGSLHRALGAFAQRGVNLTRIESRPTRRKAWEYAFCLDLTGHRSDPAVVEALDELAGEVLMCRVLGSYPQGGPIQGD